MYWKSKYFCNFITFKCSNKTSPNTFINST